MTGEESCHMFTDVKKTKTYGLENQDLENLELRDRDGVAGGTKRLE